MSRRRGREACSPQQARAWKAWESPGEGRRRAHLRGARQPELAQTRVKTALKCRDGFRAILARSDDSGRFWITKGAVSWGEIEGPRPSGIVTFTVASLL